MISFKNKESLHDTGSSNHFLTPTSSVSIVISNFEPDFKDENSRYYYFNPYSSTSINNLKRILDTFESNISSISFEVKKSYQKERSVKEQNSSCYIFKT